MKSKSMLLLGVATMCGLVAMFGVQRVLSQSKNGKSQTVKVLVAKIDIEPGIKLDATNVGFKEVPVELVPKGSITKAEEFDERALKHPAFIGQVIPQANLGEKGVFGGTIQIPDGMRVASVAVNQTMTHSGLLKPGDYVDIIATYQFNKPKQGKVSRTKTILQAVKIYGVDDKLVGVDSESGKDDKKTSAKTVSFLVWPNSCNVLMLASTKGTLHLALRGKLDKSETQTADIDDKALEALQSELLGEGEVTPEFYAEQEEQKQKEEREKEEVPPVAPSFEQFLTAQQAATPTVEPTVQPTKVWTVSIFNGAEKQTQDFPLPAEEGSVGLNGPVSAVSNADEPQSTQPDQNPDTTVTNSTNLILNTMRSFLGPKGPRATVPTVRSGKLDTERTQPTSQN